MTHVFGDQFRETSNRCGDGRNVSARVRFHGDVPPSSHVGRGHGDRDAAVERHDATHLTDRVVNGAEDSGIVDPLDADADARVCA